MLNPRTKAEYYRREMVVPWAVAAIGCVLALGVIAYALFIQSPPENRGRRTESDKRYITAGVTAVFGVGAIVWAFRGTRRWRILLARGRLARAIQVETRPLLTKSGLRPVHVTYRVNGTEYRVSDDLLVSTATEVYENVESVLVVYDPEQPARAEILSPEIAKLPDV